MTVTVGDANEFPPTTEPEFPFEVDEGLPGGTLVGVVEAVDPDDPTQSLNFSIVLVSPEGGLIVYSL